MQKFNDMNKDFEKSIGKENFTRKASSRKLIRSAILIK
jgi:hypothetical protein